MNTIRTKVVALAVVAAAGVGVGAVTLADNGGRNIREHLTSFEEVPALSTTGSGTFRASIDRGDDEIRYRLTWRDLETNIRFAHIHFENETNNGPVVAFLCTNEANGTVNTPVCGVGTTGSVTGTITAADVGGGAAAQGIAAGEFDEFVDAIDAGATYANVHSVSRGAGEIRSQLEHDHDD